MFSHEFVLGSGGTGPEKSNCTLTNSFFTFFSKTNFIQVQDSTATWYILWKVSWCIRGLNIVKPDPEGDLEENFKSSVDGAFDGELLRNMDE